MCLSLPRSAVSAVGKSVCRHVSPGARGAERPRTALTGRHALRTQPSRVPRRGPAGADSGPAAREAGALPLRLWGPWTRRGRSGLGGTGRGRRARPAPPSWERRGLPFANPDSASSMLLDLRQFPKLLCPRLALPARNDTNSSVDISPGCREPAPAQRPGDAPVGRGRRRREGGRFRLGTACRGPA